MYVGIIVIALGVIAIIIDINCVGNDPRDSILYGSIPITLGLGVFAIGLSLSSDKKMEEFVYITFKDIIDRFEDNIWTIRSIQEANIHLTNQNQIFQFNRGRKGLVYRCRNYIAWADGVKHRVDSSEHNNISQHLINLMTSLDYEHDIRFIYEDARNLVSCYKIIWNFDIITNRREELSRLFRERIADLISGNIDDENLFNLVGEILSTIAPANTLEEMEPFNRLNLC